MQRSFEEQLHDAIELIQPARRLVALTGAGISTESGIPDFRSPGSIWQQQPPVSYQDFISKPEARQQYWQTRHRLSARCAAFGRAAATWAESLCRVCQYCWRASGLLMKSW